ncbi:MAG: DUF5684 domain-containing protein [Bacteroidota bacterium]
MESNGLGIIAIILYLGVIVLLIASMWKVYEKAGKPGWAAIVPVYNIIVLLEIVEKPLWWIALMFIPFVNIAVAIMIYIELAKRFGKTAGFGIGLLFLSFIFFPILGFGDAKYLGGEAGLEDHLVV